MLGLTKQFAMLGPRRVHSEACWLHQALQVGLSTLLVCLQPPFASGAMFSVLDTGQRVTCWCVQQEAM